jgi:hypothetical protein
MVKSAGAGPSTDGSSPAQQPCLSHFEQEFLLHQITDLICNPEHWAARIDQVMKKIAEGERRKLVPKPELIEVGPS